MIQYNLPSGHTIVPTSLKPVEVYSESEMDCIDPGKLVTDQDGNKFTITEVRYIAGRLFKVTLLPITQEVQP